MNYYVVLYKDYLTTINSVEFNPNEMKLITNGTFNDCVKYIKNQSYEPI